MSKFDIGDFMKSVGASVSELDTETKGREQIEYIDIAQIDDDPNNFYQLSNLDELAANIEMLGLQQPIRVRANPEDARRVIIVSGHRRRAAIRQLVESGREDLREIPCIREQTAGSEALQELRLIYANSDTRHLTSAEISKQAERVEALLYQLKEEGYDFPGRMRDHVAEACKVSKSKLARLKVIRDNLEPSWMPSYEKGDLSESTAYALAQMPAEHQKVIFKGLKSKNTKIRWFHEYEAKNYGVKLAAIDKLICKRGARKDFPCSNVENKRKQAVFQSHYYSSTSCAKCCDKCESLATCKNACPMLAEKAKKLRADAKLQRQQEKRAQEEKDRPAISKIQRYWQRFGEARNAADKTVKQYYKAANMYWSHSDDQKTVVMECLEGKFTPQTPLPYGYHCYLDDVERYVRIADLFGCSLDYLLCRTDNPSGMGGGAVPTGIVWHSCDEEPEIGAEIVVIDTLGMADSNVYEGSKTLRHPGVEWQEVTLWTPMPKGPTEAPTSVEPPAAGWVPLQFVNGMEKPPKSGKYYCRFDCDGAIIKQLAWWDGILGTWSFKDGGAKIDAKCLGWFPLPEDDEE